MKKICKFIVPIVLLSILLISCNSKEEKTEIIIYAATSLKDAITDISNKFMAENPNIEITCNFGSSGSLQKQIEKGSPCDLFLSASENDMNSLYNEDLIATDTLKTFISNSLVLIAPKDSPISSIDDLSTDKVKHIALGEISSVPAGKHADEALISLGIKPLVENKLVYGKNIKEVLDWVINGDADSGFVYNVNAKSSDKVKVIATIPDDLHSSINYIAGVVKYSKNIDIATKLESYLFSNEANDIFQRYGYTSLN